MDNVVKQRVIGAVVLVALAVIFVPMLLDQSEDDLGPVGGNLPDQPEQIVHDRIEPLTLPEPPAEPEPAQVVLDQATPPTDSADATAPGAAAPDAAATPVESVPQAAPGATPPVAPTAGTPEETVTAPPTVVPVPTPAPVATPTPTPAPVTSPPPAASVAAPATTAPPAVAPAPAAKPAVAPSKALSGWVVQLVATANKTKALALQEKLRALGYTAFIEEVKTAQGTLFRVRVGPELERANAENVRNRLEQQVQIQGIVTRYP